MPGCAEVCAKAGVQRLLAHSDVAYPSGYQGFFIILGCIDSCPALGRYGACTPRHARLRSLGVLVGAHDAHQGCRGVETAVSTHVSRIAQRIPTTGALPFAVIRACSHDAKEVFYVSSSSTHRNLGCRP